MDLLKRQRTARILVRGLDSICAPTDVAARLDQLDEPALLDSAATDPRFGRYTILACSPIEVLTLRGQVLSSSDGNPLANGATEIWAALAKSFACVSVEGQQADHCVPGWIGYIGYEVGRLIERLPSKALCDTPLPDLRLAFYDAIAVHDAATSQWSLVELRWDQPPQGAGLGAAKLQAFLERHLSSQARVRTMPIADASASRASQASIRPAARATSNFAPDDYRRAVVRAVRYIAAGDIFQVNLSQRFTVSSAPPALEIYRVLRERNPAWYAAYLGFAEAGSRCAILSSSPELFLSVRNGNVATRPIKGTRPRIGDAAADQVAANELWNSPKDNAELAMIIDLLRNDLGRVCQYGSVRVVEPRRLETHPTVYHLVGTIEGQLRPGVNAAQLLRATFPGGSITGAPKIRAMEIIDELEPQARSVYTGCIGIVGVDGSCEWNIAIRTILWHETPAGAVAHVPVGGGIVADSDPQGEYVETLDKARAMLEAIRTARDQAPGTRH